MKFLTIKVFGMKFFTTLDSKNIIAALRTVTVEKAESHSVLYYISMGVTSSGTFCRGTFSCGNSQLAEFLFSIRLFIS